MKKKIFITFFLSLTLMACASMETNDNKISTDTEAVFIESDLDEDNVVIAEEIKENQEMDDMTQKYIVAIPKQDRYMFEKGKCDGTLPEKNEIRKIAFSKTNEPDGGGVYFVIYGKVDFENKKSTYALSNSGPLKEPDVVQEFDLTDEEITNYLESFNSDFLKDEVQFGKGWWKVAVEYKDGSCYSYEIREAGLKNNTPENTMIKSFFDKMELSDFDRFSSSLFK